MLATAGLVLALRTAACPDGNPPSPFRTAGVEYPPDEYRCNTTEITDAASVTEERLCAPEGPGFSCCVAIIPPPEDSEFENVDHWCYNQTEEDPGFGNGDPGGERILCTNEDTGILSVVHPHYGHYFLFNCTHLEAPAEPASEGLSSGAIGGIVVGAYLGVAGAFGAFAAYRGYAAP